MIPIPHGVRFSPQQKRVYEAMQDWADKRILQRAINDPNGHPRYTPVQVIVSQIKRALGPTDVTVESRERPFDARQTRAPVEYRIAVKTKAEAA